MIQAFCILDDYNAIAIRRQDDGSLAWEDCGYMGERFEPAGLFGLGELLRELFPSAAALEAPETAAGALDDEVEVADAELVPDMEMLGEDGDPGDRILPEDMVATGDPVEDTGLTEDVLDLDGFRGLASVDGRVYAAYHVRTMRNARNPYGGTHTWAGVAPTFSCPRKGGCDACHLEAGAVDELDGAPEFDTPCRRAWERHPVAWEDAQVLSLPVFFQVVAVLPRWLRPTKKNIRTRGGHVVQIQEKDLPQVVVRWGDLDDEGNFVPGWLDEWTGERVERYSIMPAWALLDIQSGEPFKYREPAEVPRLNRGFRARVLAEVKRRYPEVWASRAVHPKKDLGLDAWQVEVRPDQVLVRTQGSRPGTLSLMVEDGQVVVPRERLTGLRLFAVQAATWRHTELELAGLLGTLSTGEVKA